MIYNYLTTTNFPKGCTNCEERISNFCCSTAWNGICCEFPLKVRKRTSKLHVINNSNSKIFTLLNQSGPRQMTMIHGTSITPNISNFQFSLFQKFLEIEGRHSLYECVDWFKISVNYGILGTQVFHTLHGFFRVIRKPQSHNIHVFKYPSCL